MSNLPNEADLDAMSELVAGCDWSGVKNPDHRARIVELVQQAMVDETLANKLAEIVDQLEQIDASMAHIGDWFQASDPHRRF